jgi:hypothetical protein
MGVGSERKGSMIWHLNIAPLGIFSAILRLGPRRRVTVCCGVRLRLLWLAVFRSLYMLSHFEKIYFSAHRFSGIAFYSIAFRLSFRMFLTDFPSGTECMKEYGGCTSLAIRTFRCTGTLRALQLWCFPGSHSVDLRLFCFSRS